MNGTLTWAPSEMFARFTIPTAMVGRARSKPALMPWTAHVEVGRVGEAVERDEVTQGVDPGQRTAELHRVALAQVDADVDLASHHHRELDLGDVEPDEEAVPDQLERERRQRAHGRRRCSLPGVVGACRCTRRSNDVLATLAPAAFVGWNTALPDGQARNWVDQFIVAETLSGRVTPWNTWSTSPTKVRRVAGLLLEPAGHPGCIGRTGPWARTSRPSLHRPGLPGCRRAWSAARRAGPRGRRPRACPGRGSRLRRLLGASS